MEETITVNAQEFALNDAKHKLTQEYLRRALIRLKKATEFFDQDISDVDEEEDRISNFISEVKRRKLV